MLLNYLENGWELEHNWCKLILGTEWHRMNLAHRDRDYYFQDKNETGRNCRTIYLHSYGSVVELLFVYVVDRMDWSSFYGNEERALHGMSPSPTPSPTHTVI